MKVQVLHKELANLLNTSSHFVSNRAQLPILANIRLSVKATKLTIQATNLEMSVSGSIGAKVDEEGEIAVSSKTFTDLIGSLYSENITLESVGETLRITADGFSGTLPGMNTADFPEVPSEITPDFVLPREKFVKALSQVLFSCSSELARPALGGVLIGFRPTGLSLVTSDGFRLSKKDLYLKLKKEAKVIVPKNILTELSRVSEDQGDVGFFVNDTEKQVLFGVGAVVLGSRLVEGEYPPFEKILPASSSAIVNVGREDLRSAVKTAAVFARDGANTIKLQIKEDSITVKAESPHGGAEESTIPGKLTGPELEIVFNYRYLEEFLGVVKGESVVMKFNSPTAAGVFLDASDEDWLHLVMPVKS